MKNINLKKVLPNEFGKLIEFDNKYLRDVMVELGVPSSQLPPSLTPSELANALDKNDTLRWIYLNKQLAGYFWLENKPDCLFISGLAIKKEFYGKGLCQYILEFSETEAHLHGFSCCRLAVIPLNTRALNAYFKYGYQVIQCVNQYFGPEFPDSFRFIMEKKLDDKMKIHSTEMLEIGCADYDKLRIATDNGWVGIMFANSSRKDYFFEKICFVKRS